MRKIEEKSTKILITGAGGQIGRVLSSTLAEQYGQNAVVISDLADKGYGGLTYEQLNVLDRARMEKIVERHGITQIYHLAALLSATGEKDIHLTWDINFNGFINVLEVAKKHSLQRIFFPSSIAVYGSDFDKANTPQNAFRNADTMYGISKVAGESWANYYWKKYGMDIRSIRYPGIIGHQSMPGGGTTDYAVDIFHQAIQHGEYNCFLQADARLPMIYMEDAIRATIELMQADPDQLTIHTSYNLQGMSFTPEELASEIKNDLPHFQMTYQPDYRQQIAEKWPQKMDDSAARNDWNWKPKFDLTHMTKDMIKHLSKKYKEQHV
ncbi:MAG TPA: NAD-dependent epimerase/dehydratase family protein [Saprospiraceae bacterium]|nr:NAD-dependent epimerase/dehydratase family protein [Saprospiraceae bacterium]